MHQVDNIFEMILMAAKRAKKIAHGAEVLVERENDKPTVIALREICFNTFTGSFSFAFFFFVFRTCNSSFGLVLLLQTEEDDEILPLQSLSIGK